MEGFDPFLFITIFSVEGKPLKKLSNEKISFSRIRSPLLKL